MIRPPAFSMALMAEVEARETERVMGWSKVAAPRPRTLMPSFTEPIMPHSMSSLGVMGLVASRRPWSIQCFIWSRFVVESWAAPLVGGC